MLPPLLLWGNRAMNRITAESFDYQAEADKTCSIEWGANKVDRETFVRNLTFFAETAKVLNLYKKLLFRGKMPAELSMRAPRYSESMARHFDEKDIDLVHGIVGIATEAGEAVEILLAMIEGGKPDRVNAVEECGDLRWYINRVLRWADVTDEQCERANIDKLHGRGFAQGFDMFADNNRNLDAERLILAAEIEAGGGSEHREDASLPLGPHGDEA